MTFRTFFTLLSLAGTIASQCQGSSVPFGPLMLRPALGDSRLAVQASEANRPLMLYNVELQADSHALTVCGWFRLRYPSAANIQATTAARWTPEAVLRSNPDLAGGAFGFPAGTNLTGTLTVDPFPWGAYPPSAGSNCWPRGVYTLAGWSSNALSVSIGGSTVTLGPGSFNRNAVPGAGSSVTVSGTGPASLGVSLTPCAEFFSAIDGVIAQGQTLAPESIITNSLKFCSWRLRLDGEHHVYRSDMASHDRAACLGLVTTQSMPRAARVLSGRGMYSVGFMGFAPGTNVTVDAFDIRAFSRWLSDDELCRIHGNGAQEILRRAIPITMPPL